MNELNNLYQEIILDHNKNPRNWGKIDKPSNFAEGFNPLCGDKINLYVNIADDVISEIKFEGNGCAISKASASVMTTLVKGKTKSEIAKIYNEFHQIITEGCNHDHYIDENLEVFCGIRDYPGRVKCAALAWHTLNDILKRIDNNFGG